ncbi:hypothetical protein TrVE_jg2885 [Triparma verrucosa]|nr:hypothetical protein TrVE_jg2885 [Triparma verrucosa]
MMLLLSVSSYNPSLFSRRAVNLPVNSHKSRRASRRAFLATPAAVLFLPQTSSAVTPAPQPTSLRDILAARDANLLRKAFLNLPPPQQEYPPWLEGTWDCTSDFAGFEFPSKKVPKENIVAQTQLPGFVKLSVARFADVGRKNTRFTMKFFKDKDGKVREDYGENLANSISAHTNGREVVDEINYEPVKNPNRITIRLRAGGRNGERIEQFVNSRKSETLTDSIFLNSELVRQVTLGGPTLQDPLVPRMVVGEYQHFWTWRKVETDDGSEGFRSNCLTAVYADAQESAAVFNEVVGDPVIVYSHNIIGKKII